MENHSVHTWKASLAKVIIAVLVMLSVLITPNTVTRAAAAPMLSKTSKNILVGATYDLNIRNKVKNSTYKWTSSNKSIATVNENGLVTGIAKGSALISCTVKTPDKTYKLTCNVAVIKPAASFRIKNKVTALNLGQKYNVDRLLSPSTSNDKTTWTSSDTSIAAPDKNGIFTALKEGAVIITGTTLSGKSDSMTVKVVDKEGTVSTQEELTALLGSGVSLITIKTNEVVELTIPSGDFTKTKLVVDAPKADVHNYGVFSSIDIKQIAANSWYENAIGNLLNVLAAASRIVIAPNAVVKIEVNEKGAALKVENNGVVEEIAVVNAVDIDIAGTSVINVPVVVNVSNLSLTTSIPLNVNCTEKIRLTLLAGAENTKIQATSADTVPTITGNKKVIVIIGTGDTASQQEVVPTPLPATASDSTAGGSVGGGGYGGGGTGGGETPSGGVTMTTNADGSITYTLPQSYTQLTAINVLYQGTSYSINGTFLTTLQLFLADDAGSISLWKKATNSTNSFNGQSMTVTGTAGSSTKTVTLNGGQNDGKSYLVTVGSDNSVTITNIAANTTFTLTKVNDNMLKISANDKDITFTPTFN